MYIKQVGQNVYRQARECTIPTAEKHHPNNPHPAQQQQCCRSRPLTKACPLPPAVSSLHSRRRRDKILPPTLRHAMFRASLRESGNSKILRTWQTTVGQTTKRKQGLGCEQYTPLMPCSPTKDVKGWLGVYRDRDTTK